MSLWRPEPEDHHPNQHLRRWKYFHWYGIDRTFLVKRLAMCSRTCLSLPSNWDREARKGSSRTCFTRMGFGITLSPTPFTVFPFSPWVNRSRIFLLSSLQPHPKLWYKGRGTQTFSNYSKNVEFDEILSVELKQIEFYLLCIWWW